MENNLLLVPDGPGSCSSLCAACFREQQCVGNGIRNSGDCHFRKSIVCLHGISPGESITSRNREAHKVLLKMRNRKREARDLTLVNGLTVCFLAEQAAVQKAQEELARQKEVIMAKDKELKVRESFKLFYALPNKSKSNRVVLLSSCEIHRTAAGKELGS